MYVKARRDSQSLESQALVVPDILDILIVLVSLVCIFTCFCACIHWFCAGIEKGWVWSLAMSQARLSQPLIQPQVPPFFPNDKHPYYVVASEEHAQEEHGDWETASNRSKVIVLTHDTTTPMGGEYEKLGGYDGKQDGDVDSDVNSVDGIGKRHGSIWSSTLTLSLTCIGAGMLALPYSLMATGNGHRCLCSCW